MSDEQCELADIFRYELAILAHWSLFAGLCATRRPTLDVVLLRLAFMSGALAATSGITDAGLTLDRDVVGRIVAYLIDEAEEAGAALS